MSRAPYKFLFYVTLSYSYPILRPIEAELIKRGYTVAWFVRKGTEAEKFIQQNDNVFQSIADVKAFNADALLAPGNNVPSFFPGIKVQVFHGFDSGKKSKFKIRGYFDLFCTQGPMVTRGFEAQRLLTNKPCFDVVETGWSKLDPLFTVQPETENFVTQAKQILYAPTFSSRLTSTYSLLDEIKRLSKERDWQWLIKFHPKVTAEEVAMYREIEGANLRVVETDSIIPLLQSADVLLSDTSSILSEFSLQNKAVVSFKNRRPGQWMVNFSQAEELENKLEQALSPDQQLLDAMLMHQREIHPYQDGISSQRVVNAIEEMIKKGTRHLKRKPLNLFRNLKMRIKLGYYST